MDSKKNILIINIHGGFPSCMISKAFQQLPTLNDLMKRSEFNTRAYPSNSSMGPSLHDIIMDAPLGSMTDSVWHEWSHVRKSSRSLFNIFKQHGYTTNMFGAFGLDRKLDPHSNMHDYPGDSTQRLSYFGVDSFETQDTAFTTQLACLHDRDVVSRVVDFYQDRNHSTPNITMVNLLGCHDIHKFCFDETQKDTVSVPSISSKQINEYQFLPNIHYIEAQENRFAKNIYDEAV